MKTVSLAFLSPHLGNPFVHARKLLFESFLKLLTRGVHRSPFLPVREAVLKDLSHVSEKRLLVLVLAAVHLALNGTQVHWPLDLLEVVWHALGLGVHGVTEGSNQTCPET